MWGVLYSNRSRLVVAIGLVSCLWYLSVVILSMWNTRASEYTKSERLLISDIRIFNTFGLTTINFKVTNNSPGNVSYFVLHETCDTVSGFVPISEYVGLPNISATGKSVGNHTNDNWILQGGQEAYFDIAAPYLADAKTCRLEIVGTYNAPSGLDIL